MNASACIRASMLAARSGCILLAASRNSRFSSRPGTGPGGGGDGARGVGGAAGAALRRAAALGVRAGAGAVGHERSADAPRPRELGQHRHDPARVVGLERPPARPPAPPARPRSRPAGRAAPPRRLPVPSSGVFVDVAWVGDQFARYGKETPHAHADPDGLRGRPPDRRPGPVDDETGGLRIAPGEPTEQGVPLEISLVEGPEAADQEVGDAQAHVYLDPAAAEALEDKVLDAQVQESGVGFSILEPPARPPRTRRPARPPTAPCGRARAAARCPR